MVLISYRYGRRARPAIQEVQQRIAELTADAEENISGVRIVKSFAREPRQLERFRRSVGRTFEQAMVATRLEATYNPAIGFLPQLGIAAVLLLGGNAVIHAHLTLGQFTTFYLLLNMLIGPMRSLGVTLNLAQRATASGARIFQILDREPTLADPPGAPPLPAGNGHVQLRDVTLRYQDPHDELNFGTYAALKPGGPGPAGSPMFPRKGDPTRARAKKARWTHKHGPERQSCTTSTSTCQQGALSPLLGATGSGKTSLVALISRLYDPVRARFCSMGPMCATSACSPCAPPWPS